MRLNQHFVVGRIKKRLLRPPAVDGWRGDQSGRGPQRAQIGFSKADDGLMLAPDGASDPVRIPAELAARLEPGLEIVVGWPLAHVVLRGAGVLVAAEGDVTHFGRCYLDAQHAIERTGYEYLAGEGVEVRVELSLIAGDQTRTVMLGPDESTSLGAYRIRHLRSFDPGDRPGPVRHPAYAFQVERAGDTPPPPRPARIPHPLDVTGATEVAAAARAAGLLHADEALTAEPDQLAKRLARYEGPRHALEETLREVGPSPPTFIREGEVVAVECARLFRGSHGEPHYGRARLVLHPAGIIEIERSELGQAPGRLRKATAGE